MLNQFKLSRLLKVKYLFGFLLLLSVGTLVVRRDLFFPSKPTAPPLSVVPNVVKINALGRLEPKGEIIKVSAPSQSMSGTQVIEVRVAEGDQVQTGQIIAVLDSRDRLQANLVEAQKQVQVAQSRLAAIKAGAKRGEVAAAQAEITNVEAQRQGELQTQQATIARLKAELQNAEAELSRNQSLFQEGAITASNLDSKKLTVITAQERLNEAIAASERTQQTLEAQLQKARATLSQSQEVRPTDINTAQAEVESAISVVNRTQIELNQSYVRAPQSGRVLKIRAKAGEVVGNDGIVQLAATDQMMAIAEVYESDISKVQKGNSAIITSSSNVFGEQLQGTVQQIGLQIAKKDVLNNDPTAATDARVVEVKIALDPTSSKRVTNLINLQVNVEIQP